MIETGALIGFAGLNLFGIAMLYYRLGRLEAKFKMLPCYSRKEFMALRRELCK